MSKPTIISDQDDKAAMRTGLVSVIIPCYRQAHYLAEAIDSALAQTYPHVEVIVVNDGSDDDTETVAKSYGDRIRYVWQHNRGLAGARNTGEQHARGQFLYFMDADDRVDPQILAVLMEALQNHHDWTAAICGVQLMDEGGQLLNGGHEPSGTECFFIKLARNPMFAVGTILIRRAALPRDIHFDETLRACEDWDYWLQIARTGAVFGTVPGKMYYYRMHRKSMSRDALRIYHTWETVLQRAHSADARVRSPLPEYANGADPEELDKCMEHAFALVIGRAIGMHDVNALKTLLPKFCGLVKGGEPTRGIVRMVADEAALATGRLFDDSPEVWDDVSSIVFELGHFWPTGSEEQKCIAHFARGLTGAIGLENTCRRLQIIALKDKALLQERETIIAECEHWERRYARLSHAFPVRAMLKIRNVLLRIKKPLVASSGTLSFL